MKNLILITLMFIVFQGKAQTTKPIDGFLGIKFGSSAAQVIEAMKAKGAILNKGQTAQEISFSNITLANRKASALFINLVNEQVCEGQFIFDPELEAKSIEYYNKLVKDISDVYGAGKESKKFKQPYTDGDGYEITAIKTGNANYQTYWRDGENYLMVTIDTKDSAIDVRLTYIDGKLRKAFNEQQKEKNKSEF